MSTEPPKAKAVKAPAAERPQVDIVTQLALKNERLREEVVKKEAYAAELREKLSALQQAAQPAAPALVRDHHIEEDAAKPGSKTSEIKMCYVTVITMILEYAVNVAGLVPEGTPYLSPVVAAIAVGYTAWRSMLKMVALWKAGRQQDAAEEAKRLLEPLLQRKFDEIDAWMNQSRSEPQSAKP